MPKNPPAIPSKQAIQHDFTNAALTYNHYASVQHEAASLLYQQIASSLEPKKTVLDIGCGTGYMRQIASAHEGDWIGLDLAYGMCHTARHHMPLMINADMEMLPLENKTVDAIVSSLAFQWAHNVPQLLNECKRVLKPNGLLAFATLGSGSLTELKHVMASLNQPVPIYELMDHTAWTKLLSTHGCEAHSVSSHILTSYYPSVRDLLYALKHIGARYKHKESAPYRGKHYFTALEHLYRQHFYVEGAGIQVSWEILIVKPL